VSVPGPGAGTGQAPARGRHGWLLSALALAAVVVALYLGLTKLLGGTLACGVLEGCDTVSSSEYSEVLGIPVGLLGAAGSGLTLAGALVWWRSADRRGLLAAYFLGLASLPFLAWLTYLELFVIHAVCIWCVTYALLVVAGFALAGLTLMRPDWPSRGRPA
jgi:uncharacterized membrane protein